MTDTIAVEIVVTDIHRTRGSGRLLALATVALDLAGIELQLCGVRVVRQPTGRIRAEAPRFRGPNGTWLPALVLPENLERQIGKELLHAVGFLDDADA